MNTNTIDKLKKLKKSAEILLAFGATLSGCSSNVKTSSYSVSSASEAVRASSSSSTSDTKKKDVNTVSSSSNYETNSVYQMSKIDKEVLDELYEDCENLIKQLLAGEALSKNDLDKNSEDYELKIDKLSKNVLNYVIVNYLDTDKLTIKQFAILNSDYSLPSKSEILEMNRLNGDNNSLFESVIRRNAIQPNNKLDAKSMYPDSIKGDINFVNNVFDITKRIGAALKNDGNISKKDIEKLNSIMSEDLAGFSDDFQFKSEVTQQLVGKIIELLNVGVDVIKYPEIESLFNRILNTICEKDENLKDLANASLSSKDKASTIYERLAKNLSEKINGKYNKMSDFLNKFYIKEINVKDGELNYTYSAMNEKLNKAAKKMEFKSFDKSTFDLLNSGIEKNTSMSNNGGQTIVDEQTTVETHTDVRKVDANKVPDEQKQKDETWYTDPKGNKYETREQLEESTPQVVDPTPTTAPPQVRYEVVDDQPEIDVRIENVEPDTTGYDEEYIEVVPYVADSTDTVSSSYYQESINDVNSSSIIQEEIEQLYEARNYITSEYSNNTLRK